MAERSRLAHLALAIFAALLTFVAGAETAPAQTLGQIGAAWGTAGTGAAQFFNPAMLGVDPDTGSVYTGDVAADKASYRIQKLSASGDFEASVAIPRWLENKPAEEKIIALHGIAVDAARERFYVIEGCKVARGSGACKKAGSIFGALRILVFKTAPESGELASAGSLSLPLGEAELYNPQTIAVNPSNGDLVILAEDALNHLVVQRIGATGTVGARFTDAADALRKESGATSLAVGPDGTVYTLTGGKEPGSQFTQAWELSEGSAEFSKVPGFAAAAQREEWVTGLQSAESSQLLGGPQLAVSPQGSTLYWKENLRTSSPREPGAVLVRTYSLTAEKTTALYGGGEERCSIATSGAGIAASGEDIVAFDYGPGTEKADEVPPYGARVLTFGPGGSGCPVPTAKFSVNGSEAEDVAVGKGATVSFDASGSELFGGFRRELIWKFGDGSERVVEFTPETATEPAEEAEPTVTHQYASAGEFTVQLEIKLSEAPFGSPPPVERRVKVEGPTEPKFKLTVSEAGSGTVTSSPGGIDCGLDCDEEYERGTVVTLIPSAAPGSDFKGWTGACAGTGTCEVTIDAAKSVSAQFAPALKPKFKLTVSETGAGTVTSSPGGIACGPACEAEYEEGTEVSLTAAAADGSEFKGWSGACAGAGACEVTLDEATSVGAEFAAAPKQRVKLTVLKTGSGIVSSAPSGIACGAICERGYEKGEVVKLTPIPAVGSKFAGWGGACAGVGACEVTMSTLREVAASFEPIFAVQPVESSSSGGGDPPAAAAGAPAAVPPRPKASPLAKCKKLKGRKRARCLKRHARKGGR
jgi:hypothetical protein